MNRSLVISLAAIPVLAFAATLACGCRVDAAPDPAAAVVIYKAGDVDCEGCVAAATGAGRKPAVLVIHDWMGVSPFVKAKVEQLAGMGYVALGADVYGKGVRPADWSEAGKLATKYKTDRALFRARLKAALDVLVKRDDVDPKRIVAIGYCFGGTGVIELARSGADIAGVISFHGGLDSPTPADGKNIKAKVLALHGADDPFVPAADVLAFQEEMRAAKVDWEFTAYGGAVHAFTNPTVGTDPSKGAAYQATADRRSWEAAKSFLAEVFAPAK